MRIDTFAVASDDRDEAHDVIESLYQLARPLELRAQRSPFAFEVRSATAADLGCDILRYGMTAVTVVSPFPMFAATTALSGAGRYTAGSEHVDVRRGDSARLPLDAELTSEIDDVRVINIRLPYLRIEQLAASQATEPLRFHQMAPASADAGRAWSRTAEFVRRQLHGTDHDELDALVVRQLTELVAATALRVFPNSVMTAHYRTDASRVGPAALRRAVAYIDAHAAEPIGLTEIAAAAGTTPRAIQAAFRRHHDLTPIGYLRRVRLDGAHRDLRAGDTTVAAVAARWGFTPGARFAEFYRAQFGASPVQTLRG